MSPTPGLYCFLEFISHHFSLGENLWNFLVRLTILKNYWVMRILLISSLFDVVLRARKICIRFLLHYNYWGKLFMKNSDFSPFLFTFPSPFPPFPFLFPSLALGLGLWFLSPPGGRGKNLLNPCRKINGRNLWNFRSSKFRFKKCP